MYAKQRPIFEQKTASNSVITPVVNNNEVPSINSQDFLSSHIRTEMLSEVIVYLFKKHFIYRSFRW